MRILPANHASSEDLCAVFGTRGPASECFCQRQRLRDLEWASMPVEERAHRLWEQTSCDEPEAPTTSGLVAYLDDEPAGWCAVEPRTTYQRIRNSRVTWAGRDEDKDDETVWAVPCFVTRAGYRRRGVSYALAAAAVGFAQERGARALEGYPMVLQPGEEITWDEIRVGTRSIFEAAGFRPVGTPTKRRVAMRIEL